MEEPCRIPNWHFGGDDSPNNVTVYESCNCTDYNFGKKVYIAQSKVNKVKIFAI